jgi:hypothetical protein
MLWKCPLDALEQQCLGAFVHLGDQVGRALHLDLVLLPETLAQNCASLARPLDHLFNRRLQFLPSL